MKTGSTASPPQHDSREQPRPSGLEAQQAATRWWRLWTLLYFILLTVGTHWPRLTISAGEGPPPDKVLHLFAFGGLTLLLSQCRVIKNNWLLAIIVIAWSMVDEITQSLPFLHRESGWMDVAAGTSGVACALAWIRATAPLPGQLAQRRRQLYELQVNDRLSRLTGWIALGFRAFLFGLLATILGVAFITLLPYAPTTHGAQTDPFITTIIAFILAGVFGLFDTFDRWSLTQHKTRKRLSIRYWLALLFLAFGCLGMAHFNVALVMLILIGINLPEPLHTVANLTLLLIFSSQIVYGIRRDLARRRRLIPHCENCGDDHPARIDDNQSGTCPECGTPFARLHNDADTGR